MTSLPECHTVAIVDDDTALLEALSGLIRSLGYGAAVFSSAEAFLGSGSAGTVGCVISDIQMPGMDGFALQSHLRDMRPDLPFVMMTSLTADGLEARARAGGAQAFFRKPIPAQALADYLAALFAG